MKEFSPLVVIQHPSAGTRKPPEDRRHIPCSHRITDITLMQVMNRNDERTISARIQRAPPLNLKYQTFVINSS